MTLWTAVASFAVVAALRTPTPGRDTALVLRAAITLRRRHALAAPGAAGAAVVDGVTGAVLVGVGVRLALPGGDGPGGRGDRSLPAVSLPSATRDARDRTADRQGP